MVKNMKKILCTDLDDTIALTGKSLLKYAEHFNVETLKRTHEFYNDGLYQNYWYFALGYKWNDEETISFLKKYYPKYLLELELTDNYIKEVFSEISKLYEVHIITSRPETENKQIYNLTLEWLIKNNIVVDQLLVGTQDKASVLKQIKPDYYIDDSYDNCKSAYELGINSIMYTSPYNFNIKHTHIRRVSNWAEILDIIKY
ncbi:hypothetical protein WR52_30405 (plasmid) [Bacillus cereus]|nr:hypothetical protein WR52_30405 [Bacillus cereus]